MREWDKFYAKENVPFGKEDLRMLSRLMEHIKKGNALDLGCGEGWNLLFLAERGFEVTGVDVSKVALGRFIENAELRNLRVKAANRPIQDYNFKEKYDIIICNYSLHYLDKRIGLRVVKNIQRITKKRGLNLISGFMAELPFYGEKTRNDCYFEKEELLGLYEGWKIICYEESLAKVFEKDEKGNPQKQKRAVVIAQKA